MLTHHIETKHTSLVTKPQECSDGELKESLPQKKVILHCTKVTKAPYCMTLYTAKAGKPHNVCKTSLLPAAKTMCFEMLGEAAAPQLNVIPVSVNIIRRHISDMASDVKER